jgi:hypothetical protein
VLRGLFDLAQLVAQAGRLGRLQARPARPITPASGVRSSWLMLARKRLLAWLAASAAALASDSVALLHQLFQVFAVPAQFLLGIVPGRDVLHHAHHPVGAPWSSRSHTRPRSSTHRVAVAAAQPVHSLITLAAAGQMILQPGHHLRCIVGCTLRVQVSSEGGISSGP